MRSHGADPLRPGILRGGRRGGAGTALLLLGPAALLVLGVCAASGCSEDASLDVLDGLWHFTFQPTGDLPETVEDLRLALDGSDVVITPVENGESRIDHRRSGSVSGTPDDFTLTADWPALTPLPGGCSAVTSSRRTLHGKALEGRLGGSYAQHELLAGSGCDAAAAASDPSASGRFGAIPGTQ